MKLKNKDLLLALEKATSPDGILITPKDDKIVISSDNGITNIKVSVSASELFDTPIFVSHKAIYAVCRASDGEDVELTLNGTTLKIVINKLKATIQLLELGDKKEPEIVWLTSTMIDGDKLLNALRETSYATSKSNTQPALQGVVIDNDSVYATDSFRVAFTKITDGNIKVNLPIEAITLINKLVVGNKQVNLKLCNTHALIYQDDFILRTRLIGDKYPDMKSLLSKFTPTQEIKVDREAFLGLVKKMQIVDSQNYVINFSKDTIKVKSLNTELGTVEDEIANLNYCDYETALSTQYTIDALNACKSKNIIIRLHGTKSPVGIVDGEQLHIIMPVSYNKEGK